MMLKTRRQAHQHDLCIGCGLCSLSSGVEMIQKGGRIVPSSIVENDVVEKSCPAKGYDLKNMGNELFGEVRYRYEIGYYRKIKLAHSSDAEILKNASSGGVMTQIALFMLSAKIVDGVISNRFVYAKDTVRTETYIATCLEDLVCGQGSKYCPTSTLAVLSKLDKDKKYLLIGTPCQIAGFRKFSSFHTEYKDIIPYTIANFCGGYRDFRELDYFVKEIAHIHTVTKFRHRGGGQPGSMLIEGENGECFKYPYPDYAKISHVVKNERCTLCMDATGELADFSCGDAWLKKMDKLNPWSIIVARSSAAESILKKMQEHGELIFREDVSEDDLIYSQKSNITSKKYRQYNRIKARNLLLLLSPIWHDEFPIRQGSVIGEFRIIIAKKKTNIINWLKRL